MYDDLFFGPNFSYDTALGDLVMGLYMKDPLDKPDDNRIPWRRRQSWRVNWVLILFFGLGLVFGSALESPQHFGTLFIFGVACTASMLWLLQY
jgi:hypothetical protein